MSSRRNLRRALMATAVLIFLAGGAELALRLAGVEPGYRVDVAGWMARPMRAHSDLTTRPGTNETFRVTINDDGLRTMLSKARTPGVTRIALFGDSTLFGWGVDDGETMPAAMHDTLTRRGIRAEVLNAGQPGYSTTQIENLYTKTVSAYTPDIVVVFVPQHDGNLVPVSDRERIEGASGPVSAVRILLANHSRVYYLLRKSLSGVTDAQPVRAAASEAQGDLVPRASHAERDVTMDRLRAALAERGGTLVIGHLPVGYEFDGTAPPRFTVPWANAYAEATGTALLDLRACCIGTAAVADVTLNGDLGHLNPLGNKLVGTVAADRVLGLLATRLRASATVATP